MGIDHRLAFESSGADAQSGIYRKLRCKRGPPFFIDEGREIAWKHNDTLFNSSVAACVVTIRFLPSAAEY
jgi:hypothetical protein